MKESRINAYAKLLIEIGLNLQKGETLIISSPVECADFARRCVTYAYEKGCREVIMNWSDSYISKERYLKADDSVFDEFPSWKADFYNSAAEENYAWLHIDADDPEALSGVDPDRIIRMSRVSSNAVKYYRDRQMAGFFKWCVASVPSEAWSKKVFPNLPVSESVEALWEAILKAVRVYDGNDPIEAWKNHISSLKSRVSKLNEYNFKYLKFKNSIGTDLTVELPDGHYWEGGDEADASGVLFCANMPTEEIFTVPKFDGVNGVVYSSKPLSLNGDLVENFVFTFTDGKITDIKAEKGLELLKSETMIDEGASYLGEVALVPYDSPISNSKILFYNTLFDENASCHLAFGDAYPLINGGKRMSKEELHSSGVNTSITHTDFMIGTSDLSVIGITHDKKEVVVFDNGNFAF